MIHTYILYSVGVSTTTAVIDAGISIALLAVFSFSSFSIYKNYKPGSRNRLYRFLHWIAFTIIYCVITIQILSFIFKNDAYYVLFLKKSVPIRFLFTLIISAYLIVFNWLTNLISQNKENEKNQLEINKIARESELAKLHMQLQPHFLFNSLNSVNALIGKEPEQARKMIQLLSDFLRSTIKKDEDQFIVFTEELKHLSLYLEIEKVRFAHRLSVIINASSESNECLIPPLLMQPVVENAIKFGLYDNVGTVEIIINAKKENNFLLVETLNPFDPNTSYSMKGTGYGLNSIERRLFLMFQRNDLLTTERHKTIYKTILKIPQ
ncbi:MAG: histidine kinase [Bacteroidetes bacterium]|nr:histidine kinase [Bacteroidota bacterium]